jgi:acetyl-CoA carboxylase biotin carboxyl carrier protein
MASDHVFPPPAPAPSATTPPVPTPPVPTTPGPTPPAPTAPATTPPVPTTGVILGLIDRLEALLRDAGVSELEVEAGGLGIMLRKPEPLGHMPGAANPVGPGPGGSTGVVAAGSLPGAPGAPGAGPASAPAPEPARPLHAVLAPLTGTWYVTPSPGAASYVRPGEEVTSGQVIGLIEAMKLFNEIKSDASGRVVRVLVEHGALVKAKQALVEIEPAT